MEQASLHTPISLATLPGIGQGADLGKARPQVVMQVPREPGPLGLQRPFALDAFTFADLTLKLRSPLLHGPAQLGDPSGTEYENYQQYSHQHQKPRQRPP